MTREFEKRGERLDAQALLRIDFMRTPKPIAI
jgi:hypothetical protein